MKSLHRGHTQSCGCLSREKTAERNRQRGPEARGRLRGAGKSPERLELLARIRPACVHGLHSHPLYNTHRSMMRRCYSPTARDYQHYGGRGIEVYPEWHDAAVFIDWIEANLGPRPDGKTLDRIDNDGNYQPGNVRWATWSEQMRNRRPRQARRPVPAAPFGL